MLAKRHPMLLILLVLSCLSLSVAVCSAQEAASAGGTAPAVEGDWYKAKGGPKITDEGNKVSTAAKIFLYPVNRIADLLDIIQLNLGLGLGLHGNIHLTRAAQLGAGGATQTKFGMDGRHIGSFNETRSELSALFFSVEHYKRTSGIGTFPEINTSNARDRLYHDVRDYSAAGAAFTLFIVSFEGEIKPGEGFDFLAGLAGFDPRHDDHPRLILRPDYNQFYSSRRGGIEKIVVVTSRVVRSPYLRATAPSGITVYGKRATAAFFMGNVGEALAGSGDKQVAGRIQRYVKDANYDVGEDIALRIAKALQDRTNIEVIPATAFASIEDQKVEKTLGGERILRLPNYKGLCEQYGADAVCDVRLLEWSLYQDSVAGGYIVRLNAEVKIIQQPRNALLADVAALTYNQKKKGNTLQDFARDEGHLTLFETQQAVEHTVSELADTLIEK